MCSNAIFLILGLGFYLPIHKLVAIWYLGRQANQHWSPLWALFSCTLFPPRLGHRFPALSDAYHRDLRKLTLDIGKQLGYNSFIREGIYVAQVGPAFETPAECRFLKMVSSLWHRGEYVFDVTSVGQGLLPWPCNLVKVEPQFLPTRRFRFPCTQLRSIELTYQYVSRPSIQFFGEVLTC